MHKPPQWQEAVAAIHAADTILIVTHIRPDGDALGSSLGLASALHQLNKTVTVAVDGGTPEFFSWLPGAEQIVGELTKGEWDLTVATDASDEQRTGNVGQFAFQHSKQIINIDHHRTNSYFGDIHLIDPDVASASQIAYRLCEQLSLNWDYALAQPLLTGLVTDTLGFRTHGTGVAELEIAQHLIQAGASLAEATHRSLDVMSQQELALWKRILPNVHQEGIIAGTTVTRADMHAVGMNDMDTGNIVSFLRKVSGVHITYALREDSGGIVKVSLRSDPGFDVAEPASALGGGGHTNASGAEFNGTIEACLEQLIPLLREAAAKGSLQIG
ncbi:MAG: DHH family phosphoesterase [Anaerolineae bacterium]